MAKKQDLAEIFDLDRSALITRLVGTMQQSMRDIAIARDDLKEIVASCLEAQLSRREIDAMKTIAKLRNDDKLGAAQEKLEALERVGKAVGFDLFAWAEVKRDDSDKAA